MGRDGSLLLFLALLLFSTPLSGSSLSGSSIGDDPSAGEKALRVALAADAEEAIVSALALLANEGGARAITLICRVGSRFPGDPVRSAVRDALQRRGDGEWAGLLAAQFAASRDPKVAVIAVEGLVASFSAEAVPALIEALESIDRAVVLTAVRGLRLIPDRRSLAPLVDLVCSLEDRRNALWAEARVTLSALGNRSYRHCEDWRKWLAVIPADWQPGSDTSVAVGKTGVEHPSDDDLPTVFGQEVASKRVVFVLDTSSSMAEKDTVAGESGSAPSSRVRMERAKAELIGVLGRLRPDVFFNIVGYSTDVATFKGKLVASKGTRLKQAIRWVGALQPQGYTSTGEALKVALSIEGVDTIILLSDGTPTDRYTGKRIRVLPIVERVRRQNRFLKVTIHTLGFRGANEPFMKQLARDSGGIYAPIR